MKKLIENISDYLLGIGKNNTFEYKQLEYFYREFESKEDAIYNLKDLKNLKKFKISINSIMTLFGSGMLYKALNSEGFITSTSFFGLTLLLEISRNMHRGNIKKELESKTQKIQQRKSEIELHIKHQSLDEIAEEYDANQRWKHLDF